MSVKDTYLIIVPLIALITGLISSYLTYYFAIKSKKTELILKFKEEKYTNLLIAMQSFVGRTANAEGKRFFFKEYYKSWLYCSDDVVKAINKMVELITYGKETDQAAGKKAVGDIVLAIRKDLLGKTNLDFNDFNYTDVVKK